MTITTQLDEVGLLKGVRELFARTYWTKGAFAIAETFTEDGETKVKARYCALGGLRALLAVDDIEKLSFEAADPHTVNRALSVFLDEEFTSPHNHNSSLYSISGQRPSETGVFDESASAVYEAAVRDLAMEVNAGEYGAYLAGTHPESAWWDPAHPRADADGFVHIDEGVEPPLEICERWIVEWNDRQAFDKDDVVSVFDRAIVRATTKEEA